MTEVRQRYSETKVMAKVEDLLEGLPVQARRRVVEWAHDKYIVSPENDELLARLDAVGSSGEDRGDGYEPGA